MILNDIAECSVYSNGIDHESARRVVLTGRLLSDLKSVYDEITDRIQPHFGLVTK